MNKRHYEHTLPNIRGSLSNTYVSFFKFICKVTHFSYTFALWKSIFMN